MEIIQLYQSLKINDLANELESKMSKINSSEEINAFIPKEDGVKIRILKENNLQGIFRPNNTVTFLTGDSYLVLHKKGENYKLFIWIGKDSTKRLF